MKKVILLIICILLIGCGNQNQEIKVDNLGVLWMCKTCESNISENEMPKLTELNEPCYKIENITEKTAYDLSIELKEDFECVGFNYE